MRHSGLTTGVACATTFEHVTVIATESLSKRFPRVTALDRLSVDIGPGVTGLVGANGAGKSTLIKILLGLSPATEGRAAVLGLDVATEGARDPRARSATCPSTTACRRTCRPPSSSCTWRGCPGCRPPPRASAPPTRCATSASYEERYRPMGGYSTGMKQRVKLAQALVHDPQLVLLDEPTNGLDPAGRDEMLGLIRRVHTDFGISVLVTSHLLGELERTSDHVVVIDGGKLLRSCSTTRLHPGHRAPSRSRSPTPTSARTAPRGARRWPRRGPRPPRPAGRATCCWSTSRARRRTTSSATPSPTSASAWSGWSSAATTSPRSSRRDSDAADHDADRAASAEAGRRAVGPPSSPVPDTGAAAGAHQTRSSTTSATAPTTARGSAAATPARSLFSQCLRGAYGLGRSAKSKVLPMILLVAMCAARADHGRRRGRPAHMHKDLPVDYTRYAIIMQARHRPVRGRAGAAGRLPRPAVQDRPAVLLPAASSAVDYVRAKFAALAVGALHPHRAPLVVLYVGALLAKLDFADQTGRLRPGAGRPWRCCRCSSRGIGLVVAALTPRRGFGVAAVIAVLAITYGAVSTRPGRSPTAQGNDTVDRRGSGCSRRSR